MMKQNGTEYKQLMNLATGYSGVLCSIFLQLFHEFESIIPQKALKASYFKIPPRLIYHPPGKQMKAPASQRSLLLTDGPMPEASGGYDCW